MAGMEAAGQSAARFATTHWSMVAAAGGKSPQARQALAALCETYWYPVYAYFRRQAVRADQAEDMTQDFFTRLLEKDDLAKVDRNKGRFRSFLLAACSHFLANERDRQRTLKRGGKHKVLSLDFRHGEDRLALEPVDDTTPEKLFERRWAMALLDQVLKRLRGEYAAAGKARLFDVLKPLITSGKSGHEELARRLDTTTGAVKTAGHRLRRRYRELLSEEIARTVADPRQVEDEIRELFAAIG
jgi:RNA polymerase sigma factor (sigma-70 family)